VIYIAAVLGNVVVFLLLFGEPISRRIRARKGQQP
jgi:hypothetical protein